MAKTQKNSTRKNQVFFRQDLFFLSALFAFVVLDQLTKYLAVQYLKEKATVVLIKDVFVLSYLENRGAAFGILQQKQLLLLGFTVLIMAGCLLFYRKLPRLTRYVPMRMAMVCLLAGAVGNLLDRIGRGYVIDFFSFELISFPVFNVADILVVGSCITLVVLLLCYYQEEEIRKIFREKYHG